MKAFFGVPGWWGAGINARRHVRKKIPFGRLCACDVQTLLFATAVKTQQLQRRKGFLLWTPLVWSQYLDFKCQKLVLCIFYSDTLCMNKLRK